MKMHHLSPSPRQCQRQHEMISLVLHKLTLINHLKQTKLLFTPSLGLSVRDLHLQTSSIVLGVYYIFQSAARPI